MAILNLEAPLLMLIAALACALPVWLLGSFTRYLRSCRYRLALGAVAFAFSGLLGFLCAAKLALQAGGQWFSHHPITFLLAIAYCGYFLFGALGCWTAVRIGGRLDSRHTLSLLYGLLEDRKNTDAA